MARRFIGLLLLLLATNYLRSPLLHLEIRKM
jgi:hypothetical protein